jgi:hypothetical protein
MSQGEVCFKFDAALSDQEGASHLLRRSCVFAQDAENVL